MLHKPNDSGSVLCAGEKSLLFDLIILLLSGKLLDKKTGVWRSTGVLTNSRRVISLRFCELILFVASTFEFLMIIRKNIEAARKSRFR